MNIGFDAKRAFLNYSGLGNYSRNLIKSLAGQFDGHQYYLYTPTLNKDIPFIESKNIKVVTPDKTAGKLSQAFWRTFLLSGQIKKDKIDVYHGLSNELPANIKNLGIKSAVTIHDLIFLKYPRLYKAFDREIYNRKFKISCLNADVVVAVSQQTKNDIVDNYNISGDKIKVIYQGCDESFTQEVPAETIAKTKQLHKLPDDYILYVGTIEERKNVLDAIKALHLGKIDMPLVVVGKPTSYLKKISDYIAQNQVRNVVFLFSEIFFK